jgi:peptidoglycan/xylan/chitin deacetylase (PgdA/CDA1 family)
MTRKVICWHLAKVLILLGYVKRAKQESFRDGIIQSIQFHNPSRQLFKRVVVWLKNNGYVFISCDQLIQILGGIIPCPSGAAWVSLDDGWKGNITNVIPTIVEHNIPITIFIYVAGIEEGAFWWRKVKENADCIPVEFRNTKTIRKLSEDKRKQILELLNQAGVQGTSKREAMTVEDIRRICGMPQVTIGSHTVSHPVLPNCTEYQIDYELRESKRKLEDWIGKPIKAFAYPGGYLDGREKHFLKKYGYELAATGERRLARSGSDCYLIPRTVVIDDGSFAENLCQLLGVWEAVASKIKRIIRLGR